MYAVSAYLYGTGVRGAVGARVVGGEWWAWIRMRGNPETSSNLFFFCSCILLSLLISDLGLLDSFASCCCSAE